MIRLASYLLIFNYPWIGFLKQIGDQEEKANTIVYKLGKAEMRVLDNVTRMLTSCDTADSLFPPTELYNEGWLLRIFLDWFSTHKIDKHPLSFSQGARWFSEALLPSAFLTRNREDPLGESRTHADGVIGYFVIGDSGRADLSLTKDASHFVVLEAKMFSKLSPRVTHAAYFDQAARSVACMAEVLRLKEISPADMSNLGFYVLAPRVQIDEGIFEEEMSRESIKTKVERRVAEYKGEKNQWFAEWFHATMQNIEMGCVSWEDLLRDVADHDSDSAQEIEQFYKKCLKFNSGGSREMRF
jgi:hypothetical protein